MQRWTAMSDDSYNSSSERSNPYTMPLIECGKCGHEHHIDATTGEYQGRCEVCFGFLRLPTDEELEQFTDWYVWNCENRSLHTDSERIEGDTT